MDLFRAFIFICLVSSAAAAPSRRAASSGKSLFFESDIRPILKAHCFHCHGEGEKPKGDIDLRLRRWIVEKVVEEGPLLTPSQPHKSRMLEVIRSGEMPKGEKKLSPEEMNIIERWIAQGAPTRRDEPSEIPHGFHVTEEERAFWAFQPIRRPQVPTVPPSLRSGVKTPIDAFLLAAMSREKMSPAPAASRELLLRRVYLDLVGFPPTAMETAEFLSDFNSTAFEKVIDRLLASPAYGERWGRHWLDVAGYADSNGYTEADTPRPHAWRYRDYVIESFNQDKPWDRFIQEQIAGDELAGPLEVPPTPLQREQITATGFLRMAPDGTDDSPPDADLAKNQVVAETIKIVSSSLLGLTVGCAQCHDHRYDPISQRDYHRLRAIFDPALNWKAWRGPSGRLVSLYSKEDRAKADEIEKQAQQLDVADRKYYRELLNQVFEKEILRVPEADRDAVRTARETPADQRTDAHKGLFLKYPSADVQFALDLYDPALNKKFTDALAKTAAVRASKPKQPFVMALNETGGKTPASFVFHRGDSAQPREEVTPGDLTVLDRVYGTNLAATPTSTGSSGRRLAWARDLTDGRHPLVARVLVNRFWMHHFGRGLVNTPGDFGRLGERPTHPALLDWLADEFMRGGWQLKRLHKLILLSAAYQRSTQHPPSLSVDPDNRFYSRMSLRRVDAEALRDSVIAVAGGLNHKFFGEPVGVAMDAEGRVVTGMQQADGNGDAIDATPWGAEDLRRSVYVKMRRRTPLTVLETFDGPVMNPNCELRPSTTVAPQSLLLLNDRFILTQSDRLALNLVRQFASQPSLQIMTAWEQVFGVPISPKELGVALQFLEEQENLLASPPSGTKTPDPKAIVKSPEEKALSAFCQVLFSSNRFLYQP